MDELAFVEAYLARLSMDRPPRPDAATLGALQASHLQTVPFENLSIHLGEPITLDPEAIADKILGRRRGGLCYELNGLFARLLGSLGYAVTLLAGSVWDGHRLGPPLDHLALQVMCDGDPAPWLVDVGFGRHSLYPLRMDCLSDQADPGGLFRIEPAGTGDLDVRREGVVQYRLETHPRVLADFEAMCWYQQSSPASHFTATTVCTVQTPGGRITLSEDQLIRTEGQTRVQTTLPDGPAILDAYRTLFGIDLDQVPRAAVR